MMMYSKSLKWMSSLTVRCRKYRCTSILLVGRELMCVLSAVLSGPCVIVSDNIGPRSISAVMYSFLFHHAQQQQYHRIASCVCLPYLFYIYFFLDLLMSVFI